MTNKAQTTTARIRGWISYANVTATIAVFLGMSGAAFAVTTAPKNSVTSVSIKDGEVRTPDVRTAAVTNPKVASNAITAGKVANGSLTGADVKDDSLSGNDVDEDSLGRVPQAVSSLNSGALGEIPPSGYAKSRLEPVRLVGGDGNPDFEGNWKNYGPYQEAGFYKDEFGVVHLTGVLDPPNTADTMFTLPVGYRPVHSLELFATMADFDEIMTVGVGHDGRVDAGQSHDQIVVLDGISFRAGEN
jgi:hypothetical protein